MVPKHGGAASFSERRPTPFVRNTAFDSIRESDWREAFDCHPKIGDVESLKMKFAGNQQWSAGEQAGMSMADEQTIANLVQANKDYERRFGYIFIVCATGKSAAQMLALLEQRLSNHPETELKVAADEQRKITHLRIDKLLRTKP